MMSRHLAWVLIAVSLMLSLVMAIRVSVIWGLVYLATNVVVAALYNKKSITPRTVLLTVMTVFLVVTAATRL